MGRVICHHDGWFFEWTSVSDGPTTVAMRRPEFEAYVREEYGRQGLEVLPARLARAIEKGTSSLDPGDTLAAVIGLNTMGPRGGSISARRVLDRIIPRGEK